MHQTNPTRRGFCRRVGLCILFVGMRFILRPCNRPYISGNGFCDFQACFALFGVGGMFGGGEAPVRTDEHIVAERDLCTVLNHQIMVGIKIISNRYVVAVITPKRRGENSLFAHFSNQFFENRLLSCAVIGRQLIVFPAFILAFLDFRLKRGIVASLKQAVERYFRFSPILNPRGSAYSPGACP